MARMILVFTVLYAMTFGTALAWGPSGHRLVGGMADDMLNPHAAAQVTSILGFSLHDAGPWLDCVKSVYKNADGTFEYRKNPAHPEWTAPCTAFETPSEKSRMEDYAGRNWSTCDFGDRGCHETFHFADVAIERDGYDRSYFGTSDHDIVSATVAAILVLQDKPSPPPISIKDKKEALFVLAHLLGDLHQPLHVGSVYLDANGNLIDPDHSAHDSDNDTVGGNSLIDGDVKFHTEWDAVPNYSPAQIQSMTAKAKTLPADTGSVTSWPKAWASDTILESRKAFSGSTFGNEDHKTWPISFPDPAKHRADELKQKTTQLEKAAAHLAELLNAIWP